MPHSGDRELELTNLLGDCGESLEVDLTPCGGSGVGGGVVMASPTGSIDVRMLSTSVFIWAIVWLMRHVRSPRRFP